MALGSSSCGDSRLLFSIGRNRQSSKCWPSLTGTGDPGTGRIGFDRQLIFTMEKKRDKHAADSSVGEITAEVPAC
jgi:hypothetical protein